MEEHYGPSHKTDDLFYLLHTEAQHPRREFESGMDIGGPGQGSAGLHGQFFLPPGGQEPYCCIR